MIARALKRWFGPVDPVVLKRHEIVPGVDKPSLVLATMLCGKMLANPEYTTKKTSKERGAHSYTVVDTSTFKGDGYLIEFITTEYSGMYTSPHRKLNVVLPAGVSFDGPERTMLWDTFEKVQVLMQKKAAADAETARQEKAVKAIADFFVTPDPVIDTVTAVGGGKRKRHKSGKTTELEA